MGVPSMSDSLEVRGDDAGMFSYIALEDRIPASHPLRAVRQLADLVLAEMSPEFDRLYQAAKLLPDSAERNALYKEMSRRARGDTVWKLGVSRLRTMLIQPGVKAYKMHPILHAEWQYIDVEAR